MSKVDDIWADDKLGRNNDAEFLEAFLIGRHEERKRAGIKGSYVLNVNAEWGFGKTFFMERFAKQLSEKHPVVFIDAWKNDFSDDPYTAVISEIDKFFQDHIPKRESTKQTKVKSALTAVRRQTGKILIAGAKGAVKQLVRKGLGEAGEEIADIVRDQIQTDSDVMDIAGDAAKEGFDQVEEKIVKIAEEAIDAFALNRIEEYQEVKRSQEQFKESLAALLLEFDRISTLQMPFFIFIDELDRCRPTYAIGMLERLKHLFDIGDIVFVISTDTKQLSHSVSGLYGNEFDGQRYLQRFFTRTYTLKKPRPDQFLAAMIDRSGIDEKKWQSVPSVGGNREFLTNAVTAFKMSLRDMERAMEVLFDVSTTWKHPFPIQLSVMFPLIYGYISHQDIDSLEEFGWLRSGLERHRWWIERIPSQYTRDEFFQPNVSDYCINLVVFAKKSIRELQHEFSSMTGDEKSTYVARWTAHEVISEFNQVSAGNQRNGFISPINRYPEIIKHAGNLSERSF